MSVVNPSFNPSGNLGVTAIKEAAAVFERAILENAEPCRRRSIALTHLETAAMFAVKAVVEPDNG